MTMESLGNKYLLGVLNKMLLWRMRGVIIPSSAYYSLQLSTLAARVGLIAMSPYETQTSSNQGLCFFEKGVKHTERWASLSGR